MAARNRFTLNGKNRDSYLELVMAFPLTSIKSERRLAEAHSVVDGLFATGKLDRGAEAYIDALSDLVATYEEVHHSIGPASDADMLRHLMDARAMTQAQLSQATGLAKSSLSEVLSGKKAFSRRMIRKLADYFQIDVSILAANL